MEDDSFHNFQTTPTVDNDLSFNNYLTLSTSEPAKMNASSATNFMDLLSYPKRTAEEVRKSMKRASTTPIACKQDLSDSSIDFDSNLTSPSSLAIAKRDSDIKTAFVRNH